MCACVHTLEERGVGEVTMCVHESNFFVFFVFFCFLFFCFFCFVFFAILSIKIMPTYIYLRFESQ